MAHAVTLERAAIGPNGTAGFWKVETARSKTKKPVYCTISEQVAKQILAGARPTGKYLFVQAVPRGEKKRRAFVQLWGRRISQLGEADSANMSRQNWDN